MEVVSELKPPSKWALREELIQKTYEQLQGPAGGPEEEINQDPRQRYMVGLLAPQEQDTKEDIASDQDLKAIHLDEDEQPEPGAIPEEGSVESPVAKAIPMFEPASCGLSFTVAPTAESLEIELNFGIYRRVESTEPEPQHKWVWKRTPVKATCHEVSLKACQNKPLVLNLDQGLPNPGLEVKITMRQHSNCWVVTVFLLNNQKPLKTKKSEAYLFQTEITVTAPDQQAIFIKRLSPHLQARLDARDRYEKQAMDMLYRKHLEFAVGHGVSVHVDTLIDQNQNAWRIQTRPIPSFEVPLTQHSQISGLETDMFTLSTANQTELITGLNPLVTAYRDWAAQRQEQYLQTPEEFSDFETAPELALSRINQACQRIQAGIELLAHDAQARKAFQAANAAMHQQRVHSIWAHENRKTPQNSDLNSVDIPKNRSWRPFQLAFILINLPGLSDLEHEERSENRDALADLLWFPTGGGKTEAYLGLTAYTLFLRRLQGVVEGYDGEQGVAVLMRYTLRLLTLQQFQRASALICACELIRQSDPDTWKQTPFRIGLWVGQNTTPNTTKNSQDYIEKLLNGNYFQKQEASAQANPVQLSHCPWCGHKIDPGKDVRVEGAYPKERGRTLIYCGSMFGCAFNKNKSAAEGLPIVVVDQEIYRLLPSLVIATVDKFAQMPWKGQIQMLFGQVNQYCSRHGFRSPETEDSDSHTATQSLPAAHSQRIHSLRPPDLIIQDELHLISGPLGSMVGLYETAVDKLCSWQVKGKTIRPKIVMSTATIRRSAAQVRALFNRQVSIFPPHGLDIEDNFFAQQIKPDAQNPGRRYLGVCAPGRKIKELQIAVYAQLLAAAGNLYQKYGAHADPWMTLVGYFNTTRELGGTVTLIRDDIQEQLKSMRKEGLTQRKIADHAVAELTSRISSDKIKDILEKIEMGFDPVKDIERKHAVEEAKNNKTDYAGPPRPADVLLATNMISVGVDIERLGLMVITRQPKTTAEYIQASSRVGRSVKAPGLIFTLFNWAHPRDLSHYEVFEHYHDTFYKHVEAISVTPFSSRALDRGLSALLVALIRLGSEQYNANTEAQNLNPDDPRIAEIVTYISQRAQDMNADADNSEQVKTELKARLDEWQKQIQNMKSFQKILGYQAGKGNVDALLHAADRIDPENPGRTAQWETFTCLNSLRNVEPMIPLVMHHKHRERQARPELQPYLKPTEGASS